MKIALGQRTADGPWGGGNRFMAALTEALTQRGNQVVFDLEHPDIDIILLTDPRARNPNVSFTPRQVFRYLQRHPDAVVVHRINECDERKGTRTMNARLKLGNYVADHTVFIGSWLVGLDLWRRETPHNVFLNGADERIFGAKTSRPWNGAEPFRLVTHHWGAHALKGFDVYARLDEMLCAPQWAKRLTFTYVGNLPSGFRFRQAHHLDPLDGPALAGELCRHHGYITASINEPAGMHHIEGALCGLPLLFRNSGALPEYCAGYGEMFDGPSDMPAALERLLVGYGSHRKALASYPHTATRMLQDYLSLFDDLMARRSEITKRRCLWRKPLVALAMQLPL